MENLLSLLLGIGLSAACGFRVFLPLLGAGIAARYELIQLSDGFRWLAGWPALIAFSAALLLEIAAYYIPWVDNLLDTVSTPAAMLAGTLLTASVIVDFPPLLRWSLALIAGGGAAGVVKGGAATFRGASSAATGGLGNPLVSTLELAGSLLTTILALFLPVLTAFLVVLLIVLILRRFGRLRFGR